MFLCKCREKFWRTSSLNERYCGRTFVRKVLRTFPLAVKTQKHSANLTYRHACCQGWCVEWENPLCNVVIPVWNLSFLKPQFSKLIIPVVSYSNGWPLCMFCCNWSMHNQTSCGHFYNASDYKDKLCTMTSATRLSIHESTSISHHSSDS